MKKLSFADGYVIFREGCSCVTSFASGVVTNMAVTNLVESLITAPMDSPVVKLGVKAISATSSAIVGAIVHKETGKAIDQSIITLEKAIKTARLRDEKNITNEEVFGKLANIWFELDDKR